MALYQFRCPQCEYVELEFPMKKGPPDVAPCPQCGEDASRVFTTPTVYYIGPGFTHAAQYDRPDERLKKEIAASMTHDPVTGKSWEQTDGELEAKKARLGHRMRKDFTLPQKKGAA